MHDPVATPYQAALAAFSAPNQQRIRQYLTLLAARSARGTTLAAVIHVLNALRSQVPRARQRVLTADLTQTTSHDIVAFITAARTAGLAPSMSAVS